MPEYIIDTRRMPDGTEYRSRLLPDTDPGEPEDDGQWPILRVEYKSNLAYYGQWATAYNQAATPYVAAFNELLAQRGHSTEVWERYLRIFHGTTQVRWYGLNRATDYNYVAFDTKAWHEQMGFLPNNVLDLAKERPLAEIAAWIEGDVWGIATETRWNPDQDKDEDDWEPLDSVWGFYGHKYAEERAKSELDDAVQGHKVVHRYAEHEKLSAHETEVRVILEFLEGLDADDYVVAKIFPRTEFHDPHLQRVPESRFQEVVYRHFGIDYKTIQQERDLMVQRLQEEASTS